MLFKEVHLKGIQSGTISLAFRKWEKASVKAGTLLKSPIGLIKIVGLQKIDEDKITTKDVVSAGFENKAQLLKSLRQNNNGTIFKIEVRYHSADPRIALREQNLTEEKYKALKEKLLRLDKYSKQGYWTRTILLTIKDNPRLHAIGIAKLTDYEKAWLKLNIRKLKNLGLTISHNVGYELSPLGSLFVERMLNEE